ncbi:hypothetical protein HYP58_gp47 [Vibrio phage 1.097.O._10N.286.49.B3]|uniref:Uncharacterized protein n=1 Tax=Vibrio phage 1.097.O._10N.286.49.B3 TaxID=1881383 RepID=A0A2I7R0M4_9CAUD|nr:hypothetical protein HYP58_gp47 [Vibrio phage 1.097.O._10N.286.49.B3]AUR87193.1 hypothetical protein NVP1097O_47 [Vibrio phage 1.097.O._10N.286.49.B3]
MSAHILHVARELDYTNEWETVGVFTCKVQAAKWRSQSATRIIIEAPCLDKTFAQMATCNQAYEG